MKWFGIKNRFFERGALRIIILGLLKDGPRHGYHIIQELENKFGGFYSPSPGSVYPILQLLQDQGFVKESTHDGKNIYTITKEGEQELKVNEKYLHFMQTPMGWHFGHQSRLHLHELRDEVKQTAQLIFRNAASGALQDPKTMKALRVAFAHFRSEVESIFSK